MWPWQRNGERPNQTLIRRLVALSSLGHTFLLVLLFVLYHDDATNVSRDVIAVLLDTDVTVVRVPFTKVVNKKVPVIGSGAKAAAPKAPSAALPAKKEAPPATAVITKPKVQPKSQLAKAKKEAPKAKIAAKPKPELPKLKEPEPLKVTKVEPKKIEEKKPDIQKEEIKQQPEAPVIAQAVDTAMPQEIVQEGDNVIYVGMHEYAALEVQREIQQEAQRCWKSPTGIASGVSCQIVVHIDRNGKTQDITVAEQSGILMYDVHARQAVSHMEFPRGSWGKEVVVYFKQS
jgi:outer membrane biosynthesis protein TonB